MDNNNQSGLPAIESWAMEVRSAMWKKSSANEIAAINYRWLPRWLDSVWLLLRFARKIEIDAERRAAFREMLALEDYDVRQAIRAHKWIIHGDWRFKGASPTVELADFTPTEAQYAETVTKMSAKVKFTDHFLGATPPVTSQQQPQPDDQPPTPEQVEALQAKLNQLYNGFRPA